MSEERQYRRVITTKAELEDLVRVALTQGRLDLNECKIDVDFNLFELLLGFGQRKVQCEKKGDVHFSVECPFGIYASLAYFTENVSAFNECLMGSTAITFIGEVKFLHTIFEQQVDFSHATFLDTIECFSTRFKTDVYFTKSYFNHDIYFDSATFEKSASFESATFEGKFNFRKTVFKESAFFSNAQFEKKADFDNATFEKDVNFSETLFQESTDFQSVTFFNDVRFSEAKLMNKVDFCKATFVKWAFFHETIFTKHTSFKEVKILENGGLNFDHITTHDYLGIIPSILNGEIIITDPTLESDRRSLVVDLEHCLEESTGKVFFKKIEVDNDRTCLKIRNLPTSSNVTVDFEKCGFYGKNVAFTKVDMQHVSITGGNYVAGMAFYHCEWAKERPSFDFLGHPHTLFDMLEFRTMNFNRDRDQAVTQERPSESIDPLLVAELQSMPIEELILLGKQLDTLEGSSKPVRAIPSNKKYPSKEELMLIYAHLKTQAVEGGDVQLSNDFHFWQQFYQGKFPEHQGFSWSNFYLYTSAYGVSVRLPLFWFLLTFLILWLPYDFFLIGQVSTCCEALPHWIPLEGLFVSGSASIPFIFSDSELIKSLMPKNTTHLQTLVFYGLYIVQHLIQGYLLFQIGGAIRNKVKR